MPNKLMKSTSILFQSFRRAATFLVSVPVFVNVIYSQAPPSLKPPPEDYTWWYISLFVLVAGLAAAIVWKMKTSKKEIEVIDQKSAKQKREQQVESLSFDADEEMEWLRKNQNIVDRKRRKSPKKPALNLPDSTILSSAPQPQAEQQGFDGLDAIPLPVFSFTAIQPAKTFDQLPLSNDEALLCAIEQTHDEYEEDEEVRDLAIRILTAFRTRNSVEALSQVAIYDLSASLRSKAISVLTEFDHESVFETILLGCADPTREVRAAAARGLTRLSFDRTEAWVRLLQTTEPGRLRQTARAAIEGGFVERSLDRLVHRDSKHAYEAFVLLSMIVRSGENEGLISALKTNRDSKVRAALLHVFKITRDPDALSRLYTMLEDKNLSKQVKEEIDEVIEQMNLVTA